ncbi:MAG: alkaline phosphatase D family protein [Anaerolineae bacterium]|nr:alkaline phosphatase D family protein [Gloeobacterales cyanobacterium ES-bin-313]
MLNRRSVLKGALVAPAVLLASQLNSARASEPGNLGVASGEPRPNSVVIWTRVPESYQSSSVSVTYQLSTDESFTTIVTTGQFITDASLDFTVKVTVNALSPFTRYYYRFSTTTGYQSVIGRTLTAPAANSTPRQLTFAYVSCQDYTQGFYTTYAALAQDDIDYCVMLGDNMYETGAANFQNGQVRLDPIANATTLDEYRSKYKLYMSDLNYQEVRRLFPWVYIWDDHEVFNNYAGAELSASERERQANGYTAFLEFMPVTPVTPLTTVDGVSSVELYRKISFGTLIDLFVLDERQYRDGVVCSRDFAVTACEELFDPTRTMLGSDQKDWIKSQLGTSTARWKVLLNEVMMMRFEAINLDPAARAKKLPPKNFSNSALTDQGLYINLDAWDGYPSERSDLLAYIGDNQIKNVVVWTGDIHNCYAGGLRPDFSDVSSPAVAVEVVGGSVSSAGLYELLGNVDVTRLGTRVLQKANPHIEYVELRYHVYTKAVVTPRGMFLSYEAVDTIVAETSTNFTLARFVIPNDQAKLVQL